MEQESCSRWVCDTTAATSGSRQRVWSTVARVPVFIDWFLLAKYSGSRFKIIQKPDTDHNIPLPRLSVIMGQSRSRILYFSAERIAQVANIVRGTFCLESERPQSNHSLVHSRMCKRVVGYMSAPAWPVQVNISAVAPYTSTCLCVYRRADSYEKIVV